MAHAQSIAARLDVLLRTAEIPDYPGALNGLQITSRRDVRRIAAAVDFSSFTLDETIRVGADLLLVHHGMFWGGAQALIGPAYERMAKLIAHDVAVYSSHLPLDLHPEIGNNVLLAQRLGLTPSAGFARYKTIEVGLSGTSAVSTSTLVGSARALASEFGGNAIVTPFAPDRVTRHWGICTGAGADTDTIREALERGGLRYVDE